jgi:hypothetical protein
MRSRRKRRRLQTEGKKTNARLLPGEVFYLLFYNPKRSLNAPFFTILSRAIETFVRYNIGDCN